MVELTGMAVRGRRASDVPSEGFAVVATAAGEARSSWPFPWQGVGHEPARRSVLVMQGVEARSWEDDIARARGTAARSQAVPCTKHGRQIMVAGHIFVIHFAISLPA